MKKSYRDIIDSGFCFSHTKTRLLPGKTRCQKCEQNRLALLEKKQNEFKCSPHGEKVLPGMRICSKCRTTNASYHSGVTPTEFSRLIAPGICSVCRRPALESTHGVLHIDHDHKTGTVRGAICGQCNIAIGMTKESPQTLRALARYLERHRKATT